MKNSEFIRGKVPITKEEVRAITLTKLELQHKKTFLDVGAGTGSVCIEAAVANPKLQVFAVECEGDALTLIAANKEKFKVHNLTIYQATAPFRGLPQVESVFVGGTGGREQEVIEWAYDLLTPGGTMVMNFLLLENVTKAIEVAETLGVEELEVTMIQVSKRELLGRGSYFKPNNPIYILSGKKKEVL